MTLSLIFSAAGLLISGFSFIYLLGYLRRRTGAQRILEEFEEEVNKLIAGIEAATDRNLTLLEDRSASVKAMLETLDRRIATYARELERREKQGAALDALAPGNTQGSRTEGAYAALGLASGRGIRSSLRVDSPEQSAASPGSAPAPSSAAPPAPSPAAPPGFVEPPSPVGPGVEPAPDSAPQPQFIRSANPVRPRVPLSEQAQELYRNGFSPETIAIRLGATVVEVNLALALAQPDPPAES
jgi:hypothetical protein